MVVGWWDGGGCQRNENPDFDRVVLVPSNLKIGPEKLGREQQSRRVRRAEADEEGTW